MRFRERDQSSIRSYQRISLGKRKRLVKMVNVDGISLSKAAKKLKIKLTTARQILKKYNQTGTFPMRIFRRKTAPEISQHPKLQVKEEIDEQEEQIKQVSRPEPKPVKKEEPQQLNYYQHNEIPPMAMLPPFWPNPIFPWQS